MGTLSSFFGGGGGGGDIANFKAAENINANDLVALNKNGTISALSSAELTSSVGSILASPIDAVDSGMWSYYNHATNTHVSAYSRSNQFYIRAATNTNGTLTWGQEYNVGISNSNATRRTRITYDVEHGYYVLWANGNSNELYVRVFSVSGNVCTLLASPLLMYYYYWQRFDAKYLPDVGTHVCMGVASTYTAKMVNITVNADGSISTAYAGSSIPPEALSSVTDANQDCAIADMGGGLVGAVRESSSDSSSRGFAYAIVNKTSVAFSQIKIAFTTGFLGSMPILLADKANKKIFYGCGTGTGTVPRYAVLSYSEFLNFSATTLAMPVLLTEGYMMGDVNELGYIFLYTFEGSNINRVRRYKISEGYLSDLVTTNGTLNSPFNQRSNITANPFGLDVWASGMGWFTGIISAQKYNTAGTLTNSATVLGTATESIPSGAVGPVSLINRDVTRSGLQTLQVLKDGQVYYENSSGTTLATSGTNVVGYGTPSGLKVIGAAVQ